MYKDRPRSMFWEFMTADAREYNRTHKKKKPKKVSLPPITEEERMNMTDEQVTEENDFDYRAY